MKSKSLDKKKYFHQEKKMTVCVFRNTFFLSIFAMKKCITQDWNKYHIQLSKNVAMSKKGFEDIRVFKLINSGTIFPILIFEI